MEEEDRMVLFFLLYKQRETPYKLDQSISLSARRYCYPSKGYQ